MSKKAKIVNLFGQARPKTNITPIGYALAAVMLAVITFAATSLYYRQRLDAYGEAMENVMTNNMAHLNNIKELEVEARELRRQVVVSDTLDIEGVRIKKINGVLSVNGYIKNKGRFGFGDITISAYYFDGAGDPIEVKTVVTKSFDGKALTRGQRRRFRMRIEGVPEEAKDMQFIVTDLEREVAL